MIVMKHIHTQGLERSHMLSNLRLVRIATHISDLFIIFPAQNLVNRSGYPIGDSHLGFIFRA
jgi:hypothetical protein